MHIVLCSDENYTPYLCTTILSILENNTSSNIQFYVLSLNITQESKNYITSIIKKYNQKISFIPILEQDFKKYSFPITVSYIPIVGYARLFLTDYLPKNLKKVIYLDCDIIVNGNLNKLYNTDINEYDIGAVVDSFIEFDKPEYKSILGLNDKHIYFNSGVLLINLEKWHQLNMESLITNFLNKYPNIKYQDQDIINGIFKNSIKFLDMRYNFQSRSSHRLKHSKKFKIYKEEKITMPICIYHDTGPKKAWHNKTTNLSVFKFHFYFKKLFNPPKNWLNKVEKMTLKMNIKRLKKSLIYKLLYKIY